MADMESLIIAHILPTNLSTSARPDSRGFPVSLCSIERMGKLSQTEEFRLTRAMEVGDPITSRPGDRESSDAPRNRQLVRCAAAPKNAALSSARPKKGAS